MTLNIVRYILIIGQPEPISLGDAAIKIAIVTLFIAIVGFGAALWVRFKFGPMTPSKLSTRSLTSMFKTHHDINQNDEISIVSCRRIAQGQTLYTVSWKGKSYLLGSTINNISCLAVNVDHDNLDVNS